MPVCIKRFGRQSRFHGGTRLAKIARAGAFFVTWAKDNLRFSRCGSNPKAFGSGVSSNQLGHPMLPKARDAFPWPMRRIRFVDPDTGKKLVFLINHLEVPGETVAGYKLNFGPESAVGFVPGTLLHWVRLEYVLGGRVTPDSRLVGDIGVIGGEEKNYSASNFLHGKRKNMSEASRCHDQGMPAIVPRCMSLRA